MTAVRGVFLVLASLVTLAGTFVVLPLLWKGIRDQWRRIPPERIPRAIAGGAGTALLIGVGIAVAILAPWGPDSFVYVILVGFGALMLGVLVAVAVQAAQDMRRTRAHRRGHT